MSEIHQFPNEIKKSIVVIPNRDFKQNLTALLKKQTNVVAEMSWF